MLLKHRISGSLVASAMLLGLIFPGAALAAVTRTGGADRFDTAVKVAEVAYPVGTDNVVLVNAYAPTDAAVAGPLAFDLKAPILLTDTNKLSETTKNEIKALKAKKVTLIGGTAVISSAVETELKVLGYTVLRYDGNDRYETATKVAATFDKFTKAVIVNGQAPVDALASASWAAASKAPILYTEKNVLTQVTKDALNKGGVTSSIIVGGEAVVSDVVFKALPAPTRFGGVDRYETATIFAAKLQNSSDTIYVATGMNFSDAMVIAGLAAKTNSPIIYVDKTVPASVKTYLKSVQGKVKNLSVVGGTAAVSNLQQSVLLTFAGLASQDPNNAMYDGVQSYYANLPVVKDSYKIGYATLKTAIDNNTSEYAVLDVRKKVDYDLGHIKGAINVPYGQEIAANLDKIRALAAGKTLVVACYTGQTAGQIDSLLNLAGIKTRSLHFGMGTDTIKDGWKYQVPAYPVFTETTPMPNLPAVVSPNLLIDAAVRAYFNPLPADSYKIGLPEAKAALDANPDKYLVVDIRSAADFAISHIKGAISVPFTEVGKNLDMIKEMSLGKTVIVYCYTGQTAGQTDSLLNVAGIPTKSLNYGFGTATFLQGWSHSVGYEIVK